MRFLPRLAASAVLDSAHLRNSLVQAEGVLPVPLYH